MKVLGLILRFEEARYEHIARPLVLDVNVAKDGFLSYEAYCRIATRCAIAY
jgi:hypothetical protein